jgi:hypothetical protein
MTCTVDSCPCTLLIYLFLLPPCTLFCFLFLSSSFPPAAFKPTSYLFLAPPFPSFFLFLSAAHPIHQLLFNPLLAKNFQISFSVNLFSDVSFLPPWKKMAPCRILIPISLLIAPVPTQPSLYYISPVWFTSILKMDAACFFKTVVPIYQIAVSHVHDLNTHDRWR